MTWVANEKRYRFKSLGSGKLGNSSKMQNAAYRVKCLISVPSELKCPICQSNEWQIICHSLDWQIGHFNSKGTKWIRRSEIASRAGTWTWIIRVQSFDFKYITKNISLHSFHHISFQLVFRYFCIGHGVGLLCNWTIRRLGAKGSYLPLWRVSDRIL